MQMNTKRSLHFPPEWYIFTYMGIGKRIAWVLGLEETTPKPTRKTNDTKKIDVKNKYGKTNRAHAVVAYNLDMITT